LALSRDSPEAITTLLKVLFADALSNADKCVFSLQKIHGLRRQKGKWPAPKCSFIQITLRFRTKGSAQPSRLKSDRALILGPEKLTPNRIRTPF